MSSRVRFTPVLLLPAAILALAAACPERLHAQCPGVKVSNQTSCPVRLCLVGPAGAVVCRIIPAMSSGVAFQLPAGFVINGVQSASGDLYVFPAQPPRPACSPCIQVSRECCGRICYDGTTCRIGIRVCGPPCLP
ncbi:MAG TPA: hypothetical protein VHI13_09185 [Candidatus Kapabacteria bacterium]|nr:hypothetical protein [Candidatus Kapabacteria bacterium]